MVTRKTEAVMPPALVSRLAAAAGGDVLVGGQALAVWAQHYKVALPEDVVAISIDVDFLTRSAANKQGVAKFARVLQGTTFYPSIRALTSLVGQAILEISEDEYLNVDVIFKIVGIEARRVIERAVRAELTGSSFLVMHPLHVLRSRLINLYTLRETQNEKGEMQLRLAIDVAREFLRDVVAKTPRDTVASGRSPVQRFVSEIEQLAIEDAGRKVARRHGIHVADSVDPSLIPPGPFWTKRWPGLRRLMSVAYAGRFKPPDGDISIAIREPDAAYIATRFRKGRRTPAITISLPHLQRGRGTSAKRELRALR